MAWITRGNNRYYYRSKRVGGQVLKQYVGVGPQAERQAQLDAQLRAARQQEYQARLAERTRLDFSDAPVADLTQLADLFTRATLLSSGYHQHDRGEWRKRRMKVPA